MGYTDIQQHIWLGMTSGFMGALPFGVLNLTVLQLALANRPRQALAFGFGAAAVAFVQIGVTSAGMTILIGIPYFHDLLAAISIPILLILGIKNVRSTPFDPTQAKVKAQNAFYQGMFLSMANVMAYPFWLFWGHLFVQNQWLKPSFAGYFYFSIGAGTGTLATFVLFVGIGKILWKHLIFLQTSIHKLIALTFFAFAAFQLYSLVFAGS